MLGQDFDNDASAPAHHAFLGGFGVHLIWLVLAVVLAFAIFALMNQYLLEPGRRRRRRLEIYDAIAKAAKHASEARGMGTLGAAQQLVAYVRGVLPHTFKLTGGLNEHLKKLDDVISGKVAHKPAPPPPVVQTSSELTPAQQAREAALAGGGPTIIIANNTSSASAAAAAVTPHAATTAPGAPGHHPHTHETPEKLAEEAQRLIETFRAWWGQAPLRLAEIEAAQNELV